MKKESCYVLDAPGELLTTDGRGTALQSAKKAFAMSLSGISELLKEYTAGQVVFFFYKKEKYIFAESHADQRRVAIDLI